MQQLELYERFIAPLEKLGIDYFVTGSVAAIMYGEPRLTHDVDVVVKIAPADISQFIAAFPSDSYYCPPVEVIRIETARRPRGHFNLIDHKSGLKADCYPYSGDELHAWAMANRRRYELGEGASMWVAPPEYVVVRKLLYYREGGSDKHLDDIEKMFRVSGDTFDMKAIEDFVESRSLQSEWAMLRKRNLGLS